MPAQQIVVRTVYDVPPIYFYDFPELNGKVIPLDRDGKEVKNNTQSVDKVIIPYSWYKALFEFKMHYKETTDYFNYYKDVVSAVDGK